MNQELTSPDFSPNSAFTITISSQRANTSSTTLLILLIAVFVVNLIFSAPFTSNASEDITQKDKTPALTFSYIQNPTSIAASRDGRYLFIGDLEGYIHQWDIDARKMSASWKVHKGKVSTIALSSKSDLVVSGGFDSVVAAIDRNAANPVFILSGHAGPITSLFLSSDDKYLISGSSDKTVRLWDLDKRATVRIYEGFQGVVTSLTLWEKGKEIFVGFSEGHIYKLDMDNTETIKRIEGHEGVVSTLLTMQGEKDLLLSSGWDRSIKIWDLNSMQLLRRCTGHEYWVSYLSMYKNRLVSSGSLDHSVRVWDIDTCKEGLAIAGHQSYVYSALFSGDGRFIFSLTLNDGIRQWDANTGRLLYSLPLMPLQAK